MPHNPRPLNRITGVATESSAGTLAEQVINLPVDPANGVAVLIKRIEIHMGQPEVPNPGVGTETNYSNARLSTRQGLTSLPAASDAGCIASRTISLSTAATGGMANGTDEPMIIEYGENGLLVADKKLSGYALSTGDDTTLALAAEFIIDYELVQVSREDFFAALSLFDTD